MTQVANQNPAVSQQTCCKPEGKHELSQAHGCSQLEVLRRATSLACIAVAWCLVAARHCNLGVQDPLIHLCDVFLWQDGLEGVVLGLYGGSSTEDLANQHALSCVMSTAAVAESTKKRICHWGFACVNSLQFKIDTKSKLILTQNPQNRSPATTVQLAASSPALPQASLGERYALSVQGQFIPSWAV